MEMIYRHVYKTLEGPGPAGRAFWSGTVARTGDFESPQPTQLSPGKNRRRPGVQRSVRIDFHRQSLQAPENEYLGAGVHFCATCDGPFYNGKQVAVIGGGNSATEESLLLTKFADQVTILVRGGQFNATKIIQESVFSNPKVLVRWHTEVKEFIGRESKLTTLRLTNNQTGSEEKLAIDGAFVFIGLVPNTGYLETSSVILDQWGFVVTGHDLIHSGQRPPGYDRRDPQILETSVPGIFAAGDVRDKSTKQVASAAGEGTTAALMIREYLKTV
jgi:thioredoxin reductase (NADPH)